MILPQFLLVFRELEIATINYILSNTVILTEINEAIQVMSIEGYCVCAATDMPRFESCRKVASYIFPCTLPAEFSFQRHF